MYFFMCTLKFLFLKSTLLAFLLFIECLLTSLEKQYSLENIAIMIKSQILQTERAELKFKFHNLLAVF